MEKKKQLENRAKNMDARFDEYMQNVARSSILDEPNQDEEDPRMGILTNPTTVKRNNVNRAKKVDPVRASIRIQANKQRIYDKMRPFSNPRDVMKNDSKKNGKLSKKYVETDRQNYNTNNFNFEGLPEREMTESIQFSKRNNDFRSPDMK